MTSAGSGNTSGTARLLQSAPSYEIGWLEVIYVPRPAAGAFWSHVVDGRYYERVLAVAFTLVTSAVVANRVISVQLADNNGTVLAAVPAAGAVTAGSTASPSLTAGAPGFASAAAGGVPGYLPDILAPPGWVWSVAGSGLDAGDQFSVIALTVQRYPNDSAAMPAAG